MAVLAPVLVLSMGLAACSTSSGVSSVEANQIDPTGTDPTGTDPTGTDPTATDRHGHARLGRLRRRGPGHRRRTSSARRSKCRATTTSRTATTIEIALARVPATDPDERIGSLVFNPGGPGGSGIDFLQSAALARSRRRSPRGSTSSASTRAAWVRARPSTATSRSTTTSCCSTRVTTRDGPHCVDEANGLPDTCPAATLDLAPLVGTNNAARDLDQIREALGDDQLSLRRVLLRHPARRDVRRTVPRPGPGARARRRRQAHRRLRRTRPGAGRRASTRRSRTSPRPARPTTTVC